MAGHLKVRNKQCNPELSDEARQEQFGQLCVARESTLSVYWLHAHVPARWLSVWWPQILSGSVRASGTGPLLPCHTVLHLSTERNL
jgi:hypothetical protein